ncbi:MAG: inorganic phosphate transporter [Persicimonas sp.]
MEIVLYLALAFGFYMAWTIGSNDAANAMGTSVGSGAITFKEAVIIAAIFEFGGALIAGSSVTDTMRKGILDPNLFNALPNGAELFALGMLAALIAAAIWLHLAAFLGWPVSTTHSIVGAITGFGAVSLGISNVNLGLLATIMASWLISPVVGGLLAFFIFWGIRELILDADDPVTAVKKWAPLFAFPVFVVLSLVLFVKGLKHTDIAVGPVGTMGISAGVGVLASVVLWVVLSKVDLKGATVGEDDSLEKDRATFSEVERVFRYLQTITACFVAFAHGSNDVANAVGPLAAIVSLFDGNVFRESAAIGTEVGVPIWVLLIGGIGIVVGLATYGYKVIETIGTKITEITPSRGFAAEFGAATTILVGSKLGLPLSTTHTVVGAVIGVGFARGMNALNLQIIWNIIKSWLYTLPFTAILTVLLYWGLKAIFI